MGEEGDAAGKTTPEAGLRSISERVWWEGAGGKGAESRGMVEGGEEEVKGLSRREVEEGETAGQATAPTPPGSGGRSISMRREGRNKDSRNSRRNKNRGTSARDRRTQERLPTLAGAGTRTSRQAGKRQANTGTRVSRTKERLTEDSS